MLSFPLVGPDASGLKKDAESRSIGSMTENVTLLILFAIILRYISISSFLKEGFLNFYDLNHSNNFILNIYYKYKNIGG